MFALRSTVDKLHHQLVLANDRASRAEDLERLARRELERVRAHSRSDHTTERRHIERVQELKAELQAADNRIGRLLANNDALKQTLQAMGGVVIVQENV